MVGGLCTDDGPPVAGVGQGVTGIPGGAAAIPRRLVEARILVDDLVGDLVVALELHHAVGRILGSFDLVEDPPFEIDDVRPALFLQAAQPGQQHVAERLVGRPSRQQDVDIETLAFVLRPEEEGVDVVLDLRVFLVGNLDRPIAANALAPGFVRRDDRAGTRRILVALNDAGRGEPKDEVCRQ